MESYFMEVLQYSVLCLQNRQNIETLWTSTDYHQYKLCKSLKDALLLHLKLTPVDKFKRAFLNDWTIAWYNIGAPNRLTLSIRLSQMFNCQLDSCGKHNSMFSDTPE
jgi:hypothetical protein